MSQDRLVVLACSKCKSKNYYTRKAKLQKDKLEIKKFCRKCKKHEPHKETKK